MKKLSILTIAILISVGAFSQMVLEFNTTLGPGTEVTLELYETVDVTVDWGDGTNDTYTTWGAKNHTYASEGIYTVTIDGTLTRFGSQDYNNADKLTRVISFGDIGLTSLSYAFHRAENLSEVPASIPSSVTNMSYMFSYATSFNQNIASWDVSNVASMGLMFREATAFNQDISPWDVSNVTYMAFMFHGATAFDQDISSWDVSSVTNLSYMFSYATSFNQNIGSWYVSNVTNISGMFSDATSFNQNIGGWDLSNVTYMSSMFNGATAFDQDIGSWDVSNVQQMSRVFNGAIAFDQDIGAWDVSSVVDMEWMFQGASAFNQDIGSWDVSNVQDMSRVFVGAIAFDQNIGSWNVSNVTDMNDMFYQATLSTSNYDALLNGWASQNVQEGISFHGGYSLYSCDGQAALLSLINDDLWIITDGGLLDIIITTQANDQSIDEGEDATFTIIAEGDNLEYQWRKDEVALVEGGNISGCLTNELTITNTSSADVGVYNCVITGDCELISDDAYLAFVESMFLEFNTNLDVGTEITLPLSGMYVVTVDWGDGSIGTHNTEFDLWHTYASEGTYTVKIQGSLNYFGNADYANANKLTKVTSFGDIGLTSLSYAFNNAINLTEVPLSIPSSVTSMSYMFAGATAFNQDIGSWDVSNVTDMNNMFYQATLSISNYDALLNGWASQTVHEGLSFSGGNSKYSCNGESARASLISDDLWVITDGGFDPLAGGIVITTQANDQYIEEGEDATFTIIAEGANLEFLWRKNEVALVEGGNISGCSTNELTITNVSSVDEGVYDCVITGDCGEITSDDATLIINTGISELQNINFGIYPNPTTGNIYFDLATHATGSETQLQQIFIKDIIGKTLVELLDVKNGTAFDLSSFDDGIYFISIQTEQGVFTRKVMKQ